jgi:Domain of unknown function (DUF4291)
MTSRSSTPLRQIRASFTDTTVVVYQAYPPAIAEPALAAGRFVPPFGRERMTWIKPSFLWMAYRSGWATKPGQERVLAIEITRDGFEWALAHACLSHFEPGTYSDHDAWSAALRASPVRIQWDPERDVNLTRRGHRSIQIGLTGDAVARYVDEWTVSLTDATERFGRIHRLVAAGDHQAAGELLPRETPYPLSPDLAARIGATPLRVREAGGEP